VAGRLSKKLSVLKAERDVMAGEARANELLGAALQRRLTEASRHQEAAKLALHVDEVGKITSLLLGLSGRLARVENALAAQPAPQEKVQILFYY
jgi:protein Shroom